jgi:ADP-ribosyl-[dinitrogen reductase] hydrolase
MDALLTDSALQSRVTHPHADCVAACVYVNVMIYHLLRGISLDAAQAAAISQAPLPEAFHEMVTEAPKQERQNLLNSGWVRHTLESVIWGLANTTSFEDALVQVVNLGEDADTAGAVAGALAGAYYGLDAIPKQWADRLVELEIKRP